MYEVNRSVFLLIPLDPFWNWLKSLPGNHLDGLTLEDIQADANSYLVRPCETADEVWDEIEARFEDIFAAELADWCEDESEWPDLDADIFNEWFDIQLSTVITDLEHEPIAREELENSAPRLMAVLNPLKVTLTNFEAGKTQSRRAAFHPNHEEMGDREVPISQTIYIEADDFAENPPKGFKRLIPGGEVRLRHGYVTKYFSVNSSFYLLGV